MPVNLLLAASGALPALGAMAYVDRLDAQRPEPRRALRRVAIAGALSTIPCIVVQYFLLHVAPSGALASTLYMSFGVAALTEEAAKALCVRWFVWRRPEFDERFDGIVYATRAGLGFALVENVGYLLGAQSTGAFVGMYVARAVLSVPLHAIAAGVMGHFAARKRFDGTGPGLWGGLALAVLLHGTFDAGPFGAMAMSAAGADPASIAPLFLLPIGVMIAGVRAIRRMGRAALAADAAEEARKGVVAHEHPALFVGLPRKMTEPRATVPPRA